MFRCQTNVFFTREIHSCCNVSSSTKGPNLCTYLLQQTITSVINGITATVKARGFLAPIKILETRPTLLKGSRRSIFPDMNYKKQVTMPKMNKEIMPKRLLRLNLPATLNDGKIEDQMPKDVFIAVVEPAGLEY
ncbi:unnamed protein product [Orchesella dallaii]|uniref:Uncharacterized protein n=1 Tax=Orchesella dallaii TaxID=48710 RepID=A0ABP1S0M1_9HEXA